MKDGLLRIKSKSSASRTFFISTDPFFVAEISQLIDVSARESRADDSAFYKAQLTSPPSSRKVFSPKSRALFHSIFS